jgi:peptidoglycan-associated lipoprotein
MFLSRIKKIVLLFLILSTVVAVACRRSQPPAPQPTATAPPPPPPPAPTITIRAEPATIERGGSTTLQWEARNASSVAIAPEVGNVPLTGNRSVSPTSSVSYTATATGPGGTASDVARVTVNVPPPPPKPDEPKRPPVTSDDIFEKQVRDVFFDYDKADIRPDMVAILQGNANWLRANPNVLFTIEGHCDERGSQEYNIGLGDRRANAVREFLIAQGIPASRMTTVSYGEERPVCRDQTEECYYRNRRAHFLEVR